QREAVRVNISLQYIGRIGIHVGGTYLARRFELDAQFRLRDQKGSGDQRQGTGVGAPQLREHLPQIEKAGGGGFHPHRDGRTGGENDQNLRADGKRVEGIGRLVETPARSTGDPGRIGHENQLLGNRPSGGPGNPDRASGTSAEGSGGNGETPGGVVPERLFGHQRARWPIDGLLDRPSATQHRVVWEDDPLSGRSPYPAPSGPPWIVREGPQAQAGRPRP